MVDLNGSDGAVEETTTPRVLARLCSDCVLDTGTDGCSVSLLTSQAVPVLVFSSNDTAAALQRLQLTLGEGPAVDALATRGPVLVPDLMAFARGGGSRWPGFTDESVAAGAAAHFAFPILVGAIELGVFSLYRRSAGELNGLQLSAALGVVDRLASGIPGLGLTETPDAAVRYDMVVHQAAGMVMVQLEVSIGEALARLRARAYGDGIPIATLASDVVSGRHRFQKEPS